MHGDRTGVILNKKKLSQWKHGTYAPSPEYRMALSRIAIKNNATEDLANAFQAPVVAWNLVAYLKLSKAMK